MFFSKILVSSLALFMSAHGVLGNPQSYEDCMDEARDNFGDCVSDFLDYCYPLRWTDNECDKQELLAECEDTRDDEYDDCEDKKRRRLQEVQVSEVETHACTSQNYKLSVFVEGGHVVLAGEPNCDGSTRNSKCQECPSLAFHTKSTKVGEDTHLEKTIHEYKGDDSDEKFGLGIFKLGELAEAYQGASAGTSKKYSLFKNNCASFLINVGQKLGVNPMDRKLIKFVSRKLTENAQPMILKELSRHPEGRALIHGHIEDGAVIENFVSTYIGDRVLCECDKCNDMWVSDMRKHFCVCDNPEPPQLEIILEG